MRAPRFSRVILVLAILVGVFILHRMDQMQDQRETDRYNQECLEQPWWPGCHPNPKDYRP